MIMPTNLYQKSRLVLLFILFLINTYFVFSQDYKSTINLEEAKAKAKENNSGLKISQQDYAIAKANYEQTRAVVLPKLNVSNTSTFTNNPLNAFGFKLLQETVTTADFNPDLLNDPGQVENYNTRIEVMQPIINIDGWKQRKAANLQVQAANLQAERSQDQVELEVIKTYMQLQLAYKSVEVIQKAKETALANLKMAKNNEEQGILQNADYLNVEVLATEIEIQFSVK